MAMILYGVNFGDGESDNDNVFFYDIINCNNLAGPPIIAILSLFGGGGPHLVLTHENCECSFNMTFFFPLFILFSYYFQMFSGIIFQGKYRN